MRRKNTTALMSAVIIMSLFAGCGSADKNISQNNNDYTNETQITTKAFSDGETKTTDEAVTKGDKETKNSAQKVSSEETDQTDSVNVDYTEEVSVPQTESNQNQESGYNDNSSQELWGETDSEDNYPDSGEETGGGEDSSDNGGEPESPSVSGDVNINDDSSLLASAMVNTVTYSAYADEVLRLVNIERAGVGAAPLVLDEALCNAGNMRAIEMDYSGYFSHTRPNGNRCFEVFTICNVKVAGGMAENIAAGYPDPASVVDGWMHSEGHKANILNPSYTKMGLGYSTGGGGVYNHYWAQEFAG